jgi:hypothetical protein
LIHGGASVAVSAWKGRIHIRTAPVFVAGVRGARVGVVAIDKGPSLAASIDAAIVLGAIVSVTAPSGVGRKHAAGRRIAGVVGADVAVVAGKDRTSLATAIGAAIARRAQIRIVARGVRSGVLAP